METIKLTVASCKENKFICKDGKEILFYNVFFSMSDGDILKLNSSKPHKIGELVHIGLSGKDGFLVCKIVDDVVVK